MKITMTKPQTAEEIRYHNRFGGVRKFLGRISFIFLLVWAVADFFGISQMILPQFPFISYGVTALLLYFTHKILFHITRAVGYDFFDGTGKLETGWLIVMPLLISVVMLFASYEGSIALIHEYVVHKPEIISDSGIIVSQNRELDRISAHYTADSTRLTATISTKINALVGQYAAKISTVQRRKTYDEHDIRRRSAVVAALKTERDGIKADYLALQAEKVDSLNGVKMARDGFLTKIVDSKVKAVGDHNTEERGLRNADLSKAEQWAWTFSVAMCLLFWGCSLWGCRIDCKSGIIPTHNHTEGDGHDVFDLFGFVITDIIRSRSNNIIIGLHEAAAVKFKTLNIGNNPPNTGGGTQGGNGGGGIPPISPVPPINPAQPLGGADVLKNSTQLWRKSLSDAKKDLGILAKEADITTLADAYYQKSIGKLPAKADFTFEVNKYTIAIHEAGHLTVHAAYCYQKGLKFKPTAIYSTHCNGQYKFMYTPNSFTNEELATIKMAGFAAEWGYHSNTQNVKQDVFFQAVLKKHQEQSDIIEAISLSDNSLSRVEIAYCNAIILIEDYLAFQKEAASLLVENGVLDNFEIMDLYKKHFPERTTFSAAMPVEIAQNDIAIIPTPTPTEQAEIKETYDHFGVENPVAQSTKAVRTVAQQNDLEAPSVLDDKLMLLRSKILKYAESNFTNTQANDDQQYQQVGNE